MQTTTQTQIKVTELRIGNAVSHKGKFIKVSGIVDVPIFGMQIISGNDDIDIGDVLPIPLTPEILEKAGFVKRSEDEDGIIYGKTQYTLIYTRCTPGGLGYFLNGYHNDVHLEYLHQLQNLYFALCGEELEINL